MFKKVLVSSVVVMALGFSTVGAAYNEIDCSVDASFAENSCNQCFDGGAKGQGVAIGGLSDDWENSGDTDLIMYKDLQKMPEMLNLATDKVEWSESKQGDQFWEYTTDLETKFDKDISGYMLHPGEAVTWIKSLEGNSYVLDRNEAAKGENIGMLVYTINSSAVSTDGDISDNITHKECVLFKSGDEKVTPVKEAKQLPKTGPAEFFLLLILAMILAFGLLRFRKS